MLVCCVIVSYRYYFHRFIVLLAEVTGLKLNVHKAKIMAVTRKYGPLQQPVVNNNNIEVVEILYILAVSYATKVGERPT